jgi:hypothetical protein
MGRECSTKRLDGIKGKWWTFHEIRTLTAFIALLLVVGMSIKKN